MPQNPISLLASFVPPPLIRFLAQDRLTLERPREWTYPAMVLFTDISGFTALTEHLASQGDRGAEEITLLLQTYFNNMINLVTAHGGEVLKFAGDALIAQWPILTSSSLSDQAVRAARCALYIQRTLHNFEAASGIFLTTRITLTHGDVRMLMVGGEYHRWEPVFTGRPFKVLSRLEDITHPGEVATDQATWQAMAPLVHGEPVGSLGSRILEIKEEIKTTPMVPLPLRNLEEDQIRPLIPGAVIDRISAGHAAWLAELRPVTALFVQLQDIQPETPLSRAQEAVQAVQRVIYRYEGSLNKITLDDKGTLLLAAFGLPPLSHEDDPLRGTLAALEIHQSLQELGLRCSIGVATGTGFCGTVGNDRRREYTIIGDVINIAARLMQNHAASVLTDHATYRESRQHVAFDALGAVRLKGKRHPAAIYRPLKRIQRIPKAQELLIGRQQERALLADQLQALLRDRETHVILIEGEAGIGKSRLVDDLVAQSQHFKVLTLRGEGDPIEHSRPYHAWRGVFAPLVEDAVLRLAPPNPNVAPNMQSIELVRMAPLLNPVLPYELPDNDLTTQMHGQVRAENTRRLMMHLLRMAAETQPLLIVLEDAHWMDSASWVLALQVAKELKNVLLVLALRPLPQPQAEYDVLRRLPYAIHIPLAPLSAREALELAQARLGVTVLPKEVERFITKRSEGHPFYSEELAYALRDSGALQIEADGRCTLATSLERIEFPDTLQGLVISRIDRLKPSQQLTLKVASVIGRLFPYRVLSDVYPIPEERERIPQDLQTLEERQITVRASTEPDLTYLFKHIITQEATYHLLPYAQRRQLHRVIAEWYERHHQEDLRDFYTLLAHHWERAEEPTKALNYRVLAGEEALNHGAYQEALDNLQKALALAEHTKTDPLLRGRMHRLLGEALLGLGRLQDSLEAFQLALASLGVRVPRGSVLQVLGILTQALIQAFHLLFPGRWTHHEEERTRELAQAFLQLSEAFYLTNQTIPTVYTALKALNQAEVLGPSPELALAYAGTCVIAGLIPIHPLAQRYNQRAQQMQQTLPDLDTRIQVALRTGIYLVGVGACQQAEANLLEAADLAKRLGDHRRRGECLAVAAMAAYYQGRLDRCSEHYNALHQLAQEHANPLQLAWSLDGLALVALRQEDAATALQFTEKAAPHLEQTLDPAQRLVHQGAEAQAFVRLGERDRAFGHAQRLLEALKSSQPTVYSVLEGFAAPADVFLALAKEAPAGQRRKLLELTEQALDELARYSRVFPLGAPRLAWLQGWCAWLQGKAGQARQAWVSAIHRAEELRLPYEMAQAMIALGEHFPRYAEQRKIGQEILAHLRNPTRNQHGTIEE